MTAARMLNGAQARYELGVGRDTFRRWVKLGRVPYWTDPDTGRKWFSLLELQRVAAEFSTWAAS